MTSTWHTLGIALLIVGLAGCVGSESVAPAGSSAAAGPASFDESTGAIEGTLTDTELNPIAGALIGIVASDVVPSGVSTSTDATGHFSLSHVPPGTHSLQASALGYQAAGKSVEVVVGQVTSVSLMVDKLASQEAYGETEILKGTVGGLGWRLSPQCMFFTQTIPVSTPVNTLAKTCGGLSGGDFDEVHRVDPFVREMDWKTIVVELTWTAQSAVTGKAVSLDLNAPNITRGSGGSIDQTDPYQFGKESGKAPIIIRVDNPTTLEERKIAPEDWYVSPDCNPDDVSNCAWFTRLFAAPCDLGSNLGSCDAAPVDIGAPQDLPVTMYFSYFFREPADPAFTALPDA